jgi:hypothetical protein
MGMVRPHRLLVVVGGLLLVLMAAGCSFSRGNVGDEFKDDVVAGIKKGTTRAEVVKALGAPDRIIEVNGREVLQYYRYDIKAGSLLLIIVNFSRLKIKSDDLYVFLTRDGVVDDVVFGKRTNRMNFQFWPFGRSKDEPDEPSE